MSDTKLCDLTDIADGHSAGFTVHGPYGQMDVIAVRKGDTVHAYINSCPHIGAPLEIQPGQFLNVDKTHILCSTHGALFNIDDGLCVSGPCVDEKLKALVAVTRDGAVFVS